MKKFVLLIVVASACILPADEEDKKGARHIKFENQAATEWTWLPVTLDEFEEGQLRQHTRTPMKALDYYLLLPPKYFGNIENSPERRVTFIDRETLSDQFLHADFTIPRTDGGAFEITIRTFQKGGEPLVALLHRKGIEVIERNDASKRGELRSIAVRYPEFWRYRGGKWVEEKEEVLPLISKETILDLYRNVYKGHLNSPTQQKNIFLTYDLPQSGNTIAVTGRENFMNPRQQYVWAVYPVSIDKANNVEQGGE